MIVMEHVVGIDPGLDGVGYAWLTRRGADIEVYRVFSIRTKPADPMAKRLFSLMENTRVELQGIRDELDGLAGRHPMTVVLEVPDFAGQYAERGQRGGRNLSARSMASFWQALGVIRAMAHDAEWTLVERAPGRAKKEERQQLLHRWTQHGKNPDERDAIVVAAAHLLEGATVADVARFLARP